jgi:hypothetical protein
MSKRENQTEEFNITRLFKMCERCNKLKSSVTHLGLKLLKFAC